MNEKNVILSKLKEFKEYISNLYNSFLKYEPFLKIKKDNDFLFRLGNNEAIIPDAGGNCSYAGNIKYIANKYNIEELENTNDLLFDILFLFNSFDQEGNLINGELDKVLNIYQLGLKWKTNTFLSSLYYCILASKLVQYNNVEELIMSELIAIGYGLTPFQDYDEDNLFDNFDFLKDRFKLDYYQTIETAEHVCYFVKKIVRDELSFFIHFNY